MGSNRMRIAIAALSLAVSGIGFAARSAPPVCREDETAAGTPTISSRFDPAANGATGSAFAEARARALHYCAAQACTVGGLATTRTAQLYALGAVARGKIIAGFRCEATAPSVAANAGAARELTYKLGKMSEIDDAVVKARTDCNAAPQLTDLKPEGEGFVAVFGCGS
jgi:hypothetical protein